MIQKNIFKSLLCSAFIFTLLAGSAAVSETTFPAAFDLRTEGHVSFVRNSAGDGTGNWQKGWAFAVMASLESSYLRAGGTEDPDYSEMLLLYYCYIDQDDTLRGFGAGTAGYPGALQTTGNVTKATALLSRWTGIVNETDVLFGDRYRGNKPVDAPAVRRLHSVYYLDGGKINPGDVNVKQALTDHGAVVATVWGGGLNNGNYISPKNAYYIPTVPSGGSSEYYVAIVGWDDNYSKEDFSQANRPNSNGAWIVETFEGSGTYDRGYLYISYEDATLAGGSAFVSVPADRYEFIYQYDVLGKLATVAPEGMEDSTAWFANVFEPKEAFERLEAVSFYTLSADSEYEITVYTGVTGDPDTGTKGATQTGTIKAPGYHTVDLDEPQDLVSGQDFSVVVKLKTPGMASPVAIESYSDKENPRFEMVPGRSFLSANGTTWSDTYTLTGTSKGYPCLKAFTKTAAEDVPSESGGGCSLGGFAPALFLFMLPLMFLRK